MNVTDYLKRINFIDHQEISLQNLKTLIKNHVMSIPFENLNVSIQKEIKMDLNVMYNKVIINNRGGFCFELNGLFSWLLNQLGYDVSLISCRVYKTTLLEYQRWFSHTAILVNLQEKKYLVDVGFTMSFQNPIELVVDKLQYDFTGVLKIEKADSADTNMEDSFTLSKNVNSDNKELWTPMYQFSSTKRNIKEFEQMLKWVQTPECPAIYNRTITVIHKSDYVLMVIGFRMTKIYYKDSKEINRIDIILTKNEVLTKIKTEFNMNLDFEFEPKDIL